MEEWEHVRTQYRNLPSIPQSKRSRVTPEQPPGSQDDFEGLEEDVELVLSIMDELTEELIKEGIMESNSLASFYTVEH